MARQAFAVSRRAALLLALALVVSPRPAAGQASQCYACHFSTAGKEPMHVTRAEWDGSSHARANVGCESCHGGNPRTADMGAAHRDLLGPTNAAGPVHPANIVQTCARCHQANAGAFSRSRHVSLIRSLEAGTPTGRPLTCVTCHGAGPARRPSPAAIEATCAGCHPADSARGSSPAAVRAAVETIDALRAQADQAAEAIAKIDDRGRRVESMAALFDARAAIKDTVSYLHALDLAAVSARASVVSKQLEALGRQINPAKP